jgi:DNA-binding response OmpR family regulator
MEKQSWHTAHPKTMSGFASEDDPAMAKHDPELAAWQRAFRCLIHPYLPMLETLIEMEGRLAGAAGYLENLEAHDQKQASRGVAVAGMAVEYADKLLDHFGLWDGAGPVPKPVNLGQARSMVNNLLDFVREQIVLGRMAMKSDEDEGEYADQTPAVPAQGSPLSGEQQLGAVSGPEEGTAVVTSQPAVTGQKPIIHEGTFEVEWRKVKCFLGNTMEFKVFVHLARRPGFYYSHDNLQADIWGDDRLVSKGTIQKTISNLKKKIAAKFSDLEIDGTQRGCYALKLR